MLHLSSLAWLLAVTGSLLIGLSKTGIAGIGILGIVVFAFAFPARESVGIVLPILICCDIVAVTSYRRHVVWSHLLKLFPWAGAGTLLGFLALHRVNDMQVAHIIGGLSIVLVAIHVWRSIIVARDPEADDHVPHTRWFAAVMGIIAGFATMMANGGGPIMLLYLLATGLPKMEFMGTGAVFFFIVNCFKVPFSASLGLINLKSLPIDAVFAPIAIAGAVGGRFLLPRIKQSVFENAALVLTVVAGIDLLLKKH